MSKDGTTVARWRPATDPRRWWDRAICHGTDFLAWETHKQQALCRECPVRMACLQDQLAWEEGHTAHLSRQSGIPVYGGLTVAERAQLLQHSRKVYRQ